MRAIIFTVISTVFITVATAATCKTANGYGPCMNGKCPVSAKDVCINGYCCAAADVLNDCVDLKNPNTGVSDCPKNVALCTNSLYYDFMTKECPKTCNRCGNGGSTNPTCVDKLNPSTGVSDCPSKKAYCTNSLYVKLMTEECPKTCGKC